MADNTYENPEGSGKWTKESIDRTPDGEFLTYRHYRGKPGEEGTVLTSVIQLSDTTEEDSTRFREAELSPTGQIVGWLTWESNI